MKTAADNKLSRNQKRKRDYAALAASATKESRSAKRKRLNEKRRAKLRSHQHKVSNCGNAGCSRCFPLLNDEVLRA